MHPIALERFCERTLNECVQAATCDGPSAHQRYGALYRLIKARDKTLAAAFNDLRRSTAIETLINLARLDLLTTPELDEFSDETRDAVRRALEPLDT
ncbi:MAG: peptide ABC transporter substrate-binding protein [Proteobacteria bacterium]|nr:MAG: peptide ABC transporter substrate-binding protein [Pseudomonadota bacterium]